MNVEHLAASAIICLDLLALSEWQMTNHLPKHPCGSHPQWHWSPSMTMCATTPAPREKNKNKTGMWQIAECDHLTLKCSRTKAGWATWDLAEKCGSMECCCHEGVECGKPSTWILAPGVYILHTVQVPHNHTGPNSIPKSLSAVWKTCFCFCLTDAQGNIDHCSPASLFFCELH